MKRKQYIIESTLKEMISEQATEKVTDNAPADSESSLFTPAEKKFLGKFDAYGTRHIGIIYSLSDIGIREFIARSGSYLNVTPEILLNLLKQNIIKLVPYTGWGNNDDYTIELQLSLNSVKGLGADDEKAAEAPKAGGAAATAGGETPPPAPTDTGMEVAWVVKYGDILKESVNIAKKLLSEKKSDKKQDKYKIYTDQSRMLDRLPKQYIAQLKKIIEILDKKVKTNGEKSRVIADILDNLQINLDLDVKHISRSYDFYRSQKRLQKFIDK